MAIVLMALGPFRFSVPGLSYDRIHRNFEYRWEPQLRIGSRPAQQWLGPGEETITFRGIIYPHYAGGYGQLNAMRASAMVGVPYPLAAVGSGGSFTGRYGEASSANVGFFFGPWSIRGISDEQEYFHKNGDPRKVEFSIDIVHYGGTLF